MECNNNHCSYVCQIMSVTRKDPESHAKIHFFCEFEISGYLQTFGNVFVITVLYNISRKHSSPQKKELALFLYGAVSPYTIPDLSPPDLYFLFFFFFLHDFLDTCKARRTPKCGLQ